MIRINLLPAKRRRGATRVARAVPAAPGGVAWVALMLIGWVIVGGLGWFLLSHQESKNEALRAEIAGVNTKVEAIKTEIDDSGLQQRQQQLEQMDIAITKLAAKRRTPVFVMHELASILTDARQGGGPDIDQEKYRQSVKADPQSQINERWDPSGLWLTKVEEKDGRLVIEGEARDASDLTEFTRRMRASAWFADLSHPDFERTDVKSADEARRLKWTLNAAISRWN